MELKTKDASSSKGTAIGREKYRNKLFFQPKLFVGPTNDAFEREADTVADKVMRAGSNMQIKSGISTVDVQRKCAHCEEDEKLQRKENNSDERKTEAPTVVHDAINSGSEPLDEGARSFMENRFGYNFSNVKIHNNSIAAKSAQSINALAYTSGNNIVFNEGQYAPGTETGKKLLAHELTHVVQQGHASTTIQRQVGSGQTQPQPQPVPVACPTFPTTGVQVIGSDANQLASVLSFCAGSQVIINANQKLQLTSRPLPSASRTASSSASVARVVNNTVGIIVDTDPNSLGTVVGAFDHACPGRQFINIRNIGVMAGASGAGGGIDSCSAVLHEMEEAVRARELSAQGTTGSSLFTQSHARGTTVENSIRTDAGLSLRNQSGGNTVIVGNLSGNQKLVLESTVFGTGAQARTQLNVIVCTLVQTSPTQLTCRDEVRASHVASGIVTFTTQQQAIAVFNRFASNFGFQPINTTP